MYSYTAYQLGIRSTLPLPQLAATDACAADIDVRAGRIVLPQPETGPDGVGSCITDRAAHYVWTNIGSVLICDGREIIVDGLPGVPDWMMQALAARHGLSVALQQRGHVVLHASAVNVGGRAVIFLGESGQGKSTTAAALHQRGHGVLEDDVTAVDVTRSQPAVLPGRPEISLRPRAVRALWPDEAHSLPFQYPGEEKRTKRTVEKCPFEAPPLTAVYVLAEGPSVSSERLRGSAAVLELLRHSYAIRMLAAIEPAGPHLQRCAQIAREVPVSILRRPYSLARLDDVVALVEKEVGSP